MAGPAGRKSRTLIRKVGKRKPIPRHRKRTSDANLEPGVAAATRRSQRSPKPVPANKPSRKFPVIPRLKKPKRKGNLKIYRG